MMRRLAEFGPYVPMANRLILDTDGGVDDAQALLLLIAAGRAPDAITTVYGNVSLEAATENVLAILAAAGVHIEVHAGAAQPLVETRIDARHAAADAGSEGLNVDRHVFLIDRIMKRAWGLRATNYRKAAAMFPPSTVSTAPVVLGALASATKHCATSSAVTSRPSRLPPM